MPRFGTSHHIHRQFNFCKASVCDALLQRHCHASFERYYLLSVIYITKTIILTLENLMHRPSFCVWYQIFFSLHRKFYSSMLFTGACHCTNVWNLFIPFRQQCPLCASNTIPSTVLEFWLKNACRILFLIYTGAPLLTQAYNKRSDITKCILGFSNVLMGVPAIIETFGETYPVQNSKY